MASKLLPELTVVGAAAPAATCACAPMLRQVATSIESVILFFIFLCNIDSYIF